MPYRDPMGKSLGMSEYLGSNPQSRHRLFLAQASHGLLHVDLADENQSSELDPCSPRPAHPRRQSERLPPPPEAWIISTKLNKTQERSTVLHFETMTNDVRYRF